MTVRARLSNRRQSETLSFDHAGHTFTLSFSRFPGDGRVAEIFLSSALVGSPIESLARDAPDSGEGGAEDRCRVSVMVAG